MKTSRHRSLLATLLIALSATIAGAQVFPVLQGDPVDGLGRALPILPGVALITANQDGDFKPPVVDPGVIGDVDLVVRTGHLAPGATMPPPALLPSEAAAGGSRFPGGIDIPFTVIASDGDPTVAGGHPLLGPELDGIPVVVFAFADLDRDGFIGPTNADAEGATDDARELQEAMFPVGMRVAYFNGGVAQGVIASDVGAPASAGGLPIVLTAAAYVGQFSLDFFHGTVPDGPAITTLQPFFPRLDPDRIIDTDGSAGPALPDGRIAVEFEAEFEPPVDDSVLGTPFALPTDGSSITIDRALVSGGEATSARFVQPSTGFGLSGNEPRLPLHPGAGGVLFEPIPFVSLPIDGPGNGVPVRIVPVDILGNVTDPSTPLTVDVVVENDIVIASPDSDGDPMRESVPLVDGTGAVITLDDSGVITNHHGAIDLEVGGARTDRLLVDFTGGPPPDIAPMVGLPRLADAQAAFSLDCPAPKTISVQAIDGTNPVAGVHLTIVQDQVALQELDLTRSESTPPGSTWTVTVPGPPSDTLPSQFLGLVAVARDSKGLTSQPSASAVYFVAAAAPVVTDLVFGPAQLTKFAREPISFQARFADDCGIKRAVVTVPRGEKSKRFVALNDRGRKGDATARDGTFSGRRRLRVPQATSMDFVIEATNARGKKTTHTVTVPIVP